jgi:hypothetical protein
LSHCASCPAPFRQLFGPLRIGLFQRQRAAVLVFDDAGLEEILFLLQIHCIMPGDIIIKIGNELVQGLALNQAV